MNCRTQNYPKIILDIWIRQPDFLTEDCEEGSIEELTEEFGDEYEEDELRLARLKFFSDVAN